MTLCNRIATQPSVFNNTYVSNFYNRQTNINQTFINKDNAGISYNSNVTVNNFNYFGRPTGCGTVRPGFGHKIGNFLCGYRQPVQTGCGCQTRPKFGFGHFFGQRFGQYFHQPIQRFCSSIAGTLRGFMGARFSNV